MEWRRGPDGIELDRVDIEVENFFYSPSFDKQPPRVLVVQQQGAGVPIRPIFLVDSTVGRGSGVMGLEGSHTNLPSHFIRCTVMRGGLREGRQLNFPIRGDNSPMLHLLYIIVEKGGGCLSFGSFSSAPLKVAAVRLPTITEGLRTPPLSPAVVAFLQALEKRPQRGGMYTRKDLLQDLRNLRKKPPYVVVVLPIPWLVNFLADSWGEGQAIRFPALVLRLLEDERKRGGQRFPILFGLFTTLGDSSQQNRQGYPPQVIEEVMRFCGNLFSSSHTDMPAARILGTVSMAYSDGMLRISLGV